MQCHHSVLHEQWESTPLRLSRQAFIFSVGPVSPTSIVNHLSFQLDSQIRNWVGHKFTNQSQKKLDLQGQVLAYCLCELLF